MLFKCLTHWNWASVNVEYRLIEENLGNEKSEYKVDNIETTNNILAFFSKSNRLG